MIRVIHVIRVKPLLLLYLYINMYIYIIFTYSPVDEEKSPGSRGSPGLFNTIKLKTEHKIRVARAATLAQRAFFADSQILRVLKWGWIFSQAPLE